MNLHYAVEKHTWVSVGDDGVVTLGMTDVAQNMAGDLLHAKPKKVGAVRKRGQAGRHGGEQQVGRTRDIPHHGGNRRGE